MEPSAHPPPGIFKLNFDGSFVQSVQRGGIGGVIRDWNGTIIRNFSVPVDCSDANKAELFALLIGCRELLRIGGLNPILEGDSFSSIQWGSGKATHPWGLADLVEEVQDISSLLGASFLHTLRKTNTMADGLARDGVFRTSISFDV